jgi:hypothetical protein
LTPLETPLTNVGQKLPIKHESLRDIKDNSIDITSNTVSLLSCSKNTEIVVTKQTVAQSKAVELSEQSVIIARDKAEAEIALADAIPALEAAAEALNSLKKDEITEIRSFAKPNIYVQKVSKDILTCLFKC